MDDAFAVLEGMLLAAAFGAVRVALAPGVPTAVQCLDDSLWVVCCAEPAGISILGRYSPRQEALEGRFGEPEGIAGTPGGVMICDRLENCVWTGLPGPLERVPVPGGPFSAIPVEWSDTGGTQTALTLRDAGAVALLDDGSLRILAELPGARDLAAEDMDLDGDPDLLAACCGGALYLLRNGVEDPAVETIGILDGGVKGVVAADVDCDGLPDAVGIPCARGGACWWRNPGGRAGPWRRTRMLPCVSGAKDISVRNGMILVAALFSPSAIYGSGAATLLPGRCTACCWGPDGSPVLGHRSGLIMEFRPAPSP
jgi:hypothetical protein